MDQRRGPAGHVQHGRRRRHQDQPVDAVRREDGELLRDDPAERHPEHVRPLDADRVEHSGREGGLAPVGRRIRGHFRAADPGRVERDRPEAA
jgi:hypothetical protein